MFKLIRTALLALLLGGLAVLLADPGAGAELVATCPPDCEPGYMIVEDVVYREVVRKVCKVVPDVKKHKRIIYCVKEEDYCKKHCPSLFGCLKPGCPRPDCTDCDQPRCRRTLWKKEVTVEEHDTKCVVEWVVETVPCKVYRKVPCPPPFPPAPARDKPGDQ